MNDDSKAPKMVRLYFLDGDDYFDISEDDLKAMDDAADEYENEYEKLLEEARKREREEFYFLCNLDD